MPKKTPTKAGAPITPETGRELVREELAAAQAPKAKAKPRPDAAIVSGVDEAAKTLARGGAKAVAFRVPAAKAATAEKPAPKRRGRPSLAEKTGSAHETSRMFSVRLPASEHEKIRRLLEKRGITATDWVRDLIRKGAGLA